MYVMYPEHMTGRMHSNNSVPAIGDWIQSSKINNMCFAGVIEFVYKIDTNVYDIMYSPKWLIFYCPLEAGN